MLPCIQPLWSFFFEGPLTALAVGISAVSIPIVIHLLNRRRFKIVEWAAMRFLVSAQKKNARRMQIEQLLLLLTRCLIVASLLLAMASVSSWAEELWRLINPEGGKGLIVGNSRTHRIIVIDGSMSMATKQGDEPVFFRKAKELSEKIVEEGAGRDGFSLIMMASPPQRIVSDPSEDANKVLAEIRELRQTHGDADLQATVMMLISLLKSSPSKFTTKEIYFVTDLQKSTLISSRPGDLSHNFQALKAFQAKTIILDVGMEGVVNLAVTHLELGDSVISPGVKSPIVSTLFNYGESREDVVVRLLVGKVRQTPEEKPLLLREVAAQSVRVPRGQQTPVSFAYSFPSPGVYLIQVRANQDDLEPDNFRSLVVQVRETVPVLLVNGKNAVEPFDRATEWLRLALNPFTDDKAVPSGFVLRPKVISSVQFADEKLGDLAEYDAVFLCDVPRLSPAEVRRLERHILRGGAVIISLGDQVDLGSYNDQLFVNGDGILPARLLNIQRSPPGYIFQLAMDTAAEKQDPLLIFQESAARERLLSPHFFSFIQTESARANQGVSPRTILNFSAIPIPGKADATVKPPAITGSPAILEWVPHLSKKRNTEKTNDGSNTPSAFFHSRHGRVVLITTTVNSDWGRWPASPSFPPFMQELVLHASQAKLRGKAFTVGETIDLYLNSSAPMEGTVSLPFFNDQDANSAENESSSRKVQTQVYGDGTVFRFSDTDVSGVYRLLLGSNHSENIFAVNVPTGTENQNQNESNPTRTSQEELDNTYPEWEKQIVRDLKQVKHAKTETTSLMTSYAPQGSAIARFLLMFVLCLVFIESFLAWKFGHHSNGSTTKASTPQAILTRPVPLVLIGLSICIFFAIGIIGTILLHDAITHDFLGFLPESFRNRLENYLGVPPPNPGEGSQWRLEYANYWGFSHASKWATGLFALASACYFFFFSFMEGKQLSRFNLLRLFGLRCGLLFLLLAVLLPQIQLIFERKGWPDLVLILDDSQSMSSSDFYRDGPTKEAADKLASRVELNSEEKERLIKTLSSQPQITMASRLQLGQSFLTADGDEWLRQLIEKRQFRLHIYRCASRAQRIADLNSTDGLTDAVTSIRNLKATPENDSSLLGGAVRQVLNDFRGVSLAAIIMFTDGVTTEGEDLPEAAGYSAQMGVPLFLVGLGDAQDPRDVFIHDLQCEDSVFVNDRIIFDFKVTAQGYSNLAIPISLSEKGKDRVLDKKTISIDPNQKTTKVRLVHQPSEPGIKTYVIRLPGQEGEIDLKNNQLERVIQVQDVKKIRVLYVEGYRRYEYHYLKTLLERESNRLKGNKSIDLRVYLAEADPDFSLQDRTALANLPTPFRSGDTHTRDDDLFSYDVIILGDLDPEKVDDGKMLQFLKDVAQAVQERGTGLLVLAGERHSPGSFRTTAIKDILPLDWTGKSIIPADQEGEFEKVFRPELTAVGRMHPLFRFSPDEKETEEIWSRLKEFYWFSDGYEAKRAAEVLATHPVLYPSEKKSGEKHPLIIQQFAGAGRCLFFGISEFWRWNWREDQLFYNQFWIQSIRYLARSKVGRIELSLDRQTPYLRGEPIKILVRFPDDQKPPAENTEVKVLVERKLPNRVGDVESRTILLSRLEASRAAFETILTQTPEGDYRFSLSEPAVNPRPNTECKVVSPPGEMDRLRMNQTALEKAANLSQGKFYTLATANSLAEDIPQGVRVTVNSSGPPYLVWNISLSFGLFLTILTLEWIIRKQFNLM